MAWVVTFAITGSDVVPALTGGTAPQASALAGIGPAAATDPASGRLLRARPAARRLEPRSVTVKVVSLNTLASSLSRARRLPGGTERAVGQARWLLEIGADVVGVQEMQVNQRQALMAHLPGWQMYPGGSSTKEGLNSIAWNAERFDLIESDVVMAPHTHGWTLPNPVILLRDKETGLGMWFSNFHNPADSQPRRVAASQIQADLIRTQHEDGRFPYFMTGDMNERGSWFARVAQGGPLTAPGGTGWIDFVVGHSDIQFENYRRDPTPRARRLTDHPWVPTVEATITTEQFPRAYLPE